MGQNIGENMSKQTINDGAIPNDGQGDNLRIGAGKINSNFDEIYTALGDGTNLTNGPTIRWNIVDNGYDTAYTFTGAGFPTSTDDPVLYLYRGHTYIFTNSVNAIYPMQIRVSSGGAAYTSGVEGAGTETTIFTVPMNAPSTLYYQCTAFSAMGNTINII